RVGTMHQGTNSLASNNSLTKVDKHHKTGNNTINNSINKHRKGVAIMVKINPLNITISNTWVGEYRQWLTEEQSLQNAQLVANHFGTSWSPEAISALCGNMRVESSVNPDMYEFGYDWEDDRGYGLVQWTPRSKYWDWATASGLEPRNGNSQLARIDY